MFIFSSLCFVLPSQKQYLYQPEFQLEILYYNVSGIFNFKHNLAKVHANIYLQYLIFGVMVSRECNSCRSSLFKNNKGEGIDWDRIDTTYMQAVCIHCTRTKSVLFCVEYCDDIARAHMYYQFPIIKSMNGLSCETDQLKYQFG